MRQWFKARMLRIHFTEADTWEGKPLFEEVVAKCLELGIAGVTVFRSIEGFGASARIYHARSLSLSRNAPIMVSVIDTEDQIEKLLPHLDTMIGGGLIASSIVDALRLDKSDR